MHHARRATGVCIFGLLAMPVTFLLVRHLTKPVLYPGDRLETRACRDCGGRGRDEYLAEDYPGFGGGCQACGGSGKVGVILPGPNRPSRIHGAVTEAGKVSRFASYDTMRPGPSPLNPGERPFQKPRETIAGAAVTFSKDTGEVFEVEANPFGLFNTKLPPGAYTITVEAAGFATLDETFEVPVLKTPIWLERAITIREPESADEARSLYGIEMLAALARNGKGKGHLRVDAGTPSTF